MTIRERAEILTAKGWIGLDLTREIEAALLAVVEECATKALEQRCERDTPWDLACTTIADAIRREVII